MEKDKNKNEDEVVCYVPFRSAEKYKLAQQFQEQAAKEGVKVKIVQGPPPSAQTYYPSVH